MLYIFRRINNTRTSDLRVIVILILYRGIISIADFVMGKTKKKINSYSPDDKNSYVLYVKFNIKKKKHLKATQYLANIYCRSTERPNKSFVNIILFRQLELLPVDKRCSTRHKLTRNRTRLNKEIF